VRDEAQNIQQEQQENAEVPQWLRDIQDHGPSVSCVACGVVNNPQVNCAPCWLTSNCPKKIKYCTEQIPIEQVINQIK
jgi:hypothetical protein